MDIADGLYGFFGTSDPAALLTDALVAVVLAVSLVYLALELFRIYAEYSRKEAPVPAGKPVEARGAMPPQPVEAIKAPAPEAKKPAVEIPAIEVIRGTLAESMMAFTQKYRLGSLTLASQDGLVIASTSMTPEQDAAVYSGLFQELYKVKQEPYYYVESKEVSLYAVESGAQKVIGIAYRKSAFAPQEVRGIRDDTKKVLDRFASGGVTF